MAMRITVVKPGKVPGGPKAAAKGAGKVLQRVGKRLVAAAPKLPEKPSGGRY